MMNVKSIQGFTLTEVIIAMGLSMVVVIMAGSGILLIQNIKTQSFNKNDLEYFTQNFSTYLQDKTNCKSVLAGKVVPVNFQNISINNYTGGGVTFNPAQPHTIQNGVALNKNTTINSIRWKRKGNLPITLNQGTVNLSMLQANFNIVFDVLENNKNLQKTKNFDVSVTIDNSAGGKIIGCSGDLEDANKSVCHLIDESIDPVTKKCTKTKVAGISCESYGYFKEIQTLNNAKLPTGIININIQNKNKNILINPFTGTAKCPAKANVIPRLTGFTPFGVNNALVNYLCEKCN